jgi:carbamoylphosphate synthase large subunit
MRVWFNRTYSSVHAAISLIREADAADEYHIIYSNPNPHAAAGRAAHSFFVEPTGLDGEAYLAWCLAFCREHAVDIFIPGRCAAEISGARQRFLEQGTRVLSAASQDMLELLHDKEAFYNTVQLPGAPPPVTIAFRNRAEFDAAHASLRPRFGKLCIKPAKGVYGIGFSVLDEERNGAQLLMAGAQYHASLAELRQGLAQLGDFRPMLLMEYLDGVEYSVDCVGDNGRLVCAVPRRKAQQAGHGQVIDTSAAILEATRQLAAAYGLNGVFNVQFREHEGRLRLLEINPRMSGGIGMACVAGPNLPYLALRGFHRGFGAVSVPPVRANIRVAELNRAVEIV